jgi:hypothetical protein
LTRCFARFATEAEFSGVLSTSRTTGFSPNSSFLNVPVPRLAIDGKIISSPSRNAGFLRFGMLHEGAYLLSCDPLHHARDLADVIPNAPALFVPWLRIRFRGGEPGCE